jgi:hypothetical protein
MLYNDRIKLCSGDKKDHFALRDDTEISNDEELVKTTKGITEKIDVVAEATAKNGKLDRATVDAALDRILAAMKSVNDELDELLAKARG